MGNAQEKEIYLPGAFMDMQVSLSEYNSSICHDIWQKFSNKNSSHYQQMIHYFNNSLSSFFDMCLNHSLLDEITTQPYILPWYSQLAWISVFTVMILVAIVGNLIVMWIIVAHKRMRTVTNMFLLNLAISDFLLASGNAAFNFVFMLNSHWPFGSVFCVISNVVANLTVSTSVFTILAMSLDRFVAVVFPFRQPMTKIVAVSIILLVWSLSSILCIPPFLYATTITYKYSAVQRRTLCLLQWPDKKYGVSYLDHMYNIVFLVVTYVVPILCMTVTYTWIGFTLWSSKVIGENSYLQSQAVRSKKRAVHMLVAIVLLFAVCWLPYHAYFLYIYYNQEILHTHFIQQVYLGIYWLAMSNSCYNPIVYYNMNTRFRNYFQEAMFRQTKSANLEAGGHAKQSYSLATRTTVFTTNKMLSYGMSSPKQKEGDIAVVSVCQKAD